MSFILLEGRLPSDHPLPPFDPHLSTSNSSELEPACGNQNEKVEAPHDKSTLESLANQEVLVFLTSKTGWWCQIGNLPQVGVKIMNI